MMSLGYWADGARRLPLPICLLAGGVALAALYFSWKYAVINPDVGVYLSMVENLVQGQVLYRDVYMGYTPLSVYVMAGIRWAVGADTGYAHYLGGIMVLHLINAVLVYVIAGFFTAHTGAKVLAACAEVLLALTYEGEFIMLEPFCVCFALMSLYACLRAEEHVRWLWLAGGAVALCFLSKQYGILAGAPVALAIANKGWRGQFRSGIAGAGWALGGFLLPLALLFTYYQAVEGVAPGAILSEWFSRKGYGDDDLWAAIKAWGRFHLIALPVLGLLPVVAWSGRHDVRMWLLISAWLAFSVPLYLKTFEHYYQLSLPMGILLVVYVGEYTQTRRRLHMAVWILGLVMVSSLALRSYLQYRHLFVHRGGREEQYIQAASVCETVPAQSRVMILYTNGQWLNYLCRFQALDPQEVGYAFPSGFTAAKIDQLLQIGAPVISHPRQWEIAPWQKKLLEKNNYQLTTQAAGFEIWRKPAAAEPSE